VTDRQNGLVAAADAARSVRIVHSALPTAAQLSMLQTAFGTSQFPLIKAISAAQIAHDSTLQQTCDAINRLVALQPMPSVTRLTEILGQQLSTASIMQTVGVKSQLAAIAAAGFPQQMRFAEQIGQIVSAQNSVGRIALGANHTAAQTELLATISRYGQVQNHLGAFMRPDTGAVLRGVTTDAGRRYDAYLDGLPARPTTRRATVARRAGDTQTGLLVAESLTAPDLADDDLAELADNLIAVVLEPWETGPASVRAELFAVLDDIDPLLVDLLKGAWDDVSRNGPAAASKVAHCSMELIDRSLRAVVSDDEVLAWLASERKRDGMLTDRVRPTRSARVTFLLQHRSKRDRKLTGSQIAALAVLVNDTTSALQPVKHSGPVSIAVARNYLLTTESVLMMLFGQV
jgi:hypothetical protein